MVLNRFTDILVIYASYSSLMSTSGLYCDVLLCLFHLPVLISYPVLLKQGWEETIVQQEQPDGNPSEMKIMLPSMPSLYVISFLFRACEEIHRIGGHVLDRTILKNFAVSLLEKVWVHGCRILCELSHVWQYNVYLCLFNCHYYGCSQ